MLKMAKNSRLRLVVTILSVLFVLLFTKYYFIPKYKLHRMEARIVMMTKRIEKARREEKEKKERAIALAIEVNETIVALANN